MEKGKVVKLHIEDMSSEGSGIGRSDGQVVFVENCVKGDTVKARITKAKRNYALAECLEIVEPSGSRIHGFCPYAKECGGCPLGEMEYEAQLEIKEGWVRDKLERIGGLQAPVVRPIIGMEEPFRYRNKAEFKVGPRGEVGFFARKSHRVIDCPDCRIQRQEIMGVADGLRQYLAEFGNGAGIKGMTVKMSFGTGEMMAILEARSDDVPYLEELCGYMNEGSGYNLESIFINEELVAGRSVISDEMEGLKFEISRDSFYQVNPAQTAKLYGKAVEYADVKEGHTVLDLYCGVGTIGLFAARTVGNDGLVLGIETVKQAVLDANRNSVINGIVCTRYIQGKAEEELPAVLGIRPKMGYDGENRLVEKEPVIRISHADVAFVDPPRAGCEETLLDAVAEAGPDRIVYVSCDPATLARDVKYLEERGYRFVEAQPVDMFCHTGHVECVTLMTKK